MKHYTIQGILLGVVIGIAVGIGVYTFAYAKGWSYLTDDPAACANCHVMQEQFDGWLKSSHRAVATCNSCHTPANFIGKYATKATNGFWHSFFFTIGGYEDNIQIKPHSREITEQACRNCHGGRRSDCEFADSYAAVAGAGQASVGAADKHRSRRRLKPKNFPLLLQGE